MSTDVGNIYHTPALLTQSLDFLDIKKNGVYIDATFGGGGHSRGIMSRLGAGGRLLGFDQDEDAIKNAIQDNRFTFVRSNFRYLSNFLTYYNIDGVDGILADLGVSFHHFDDESRGFSFRYDSPLDMRMNQHARKTAADIIEKYSEEKLSEILYLYGEMPNARKIASAIVKAREDSKILTTKDLLNVIEPFFRKDKEKKEMSKVFQAIRIEVNDEMGALKSLLKQTLSVLKPKGRIVVLTYHSLEDRLVKNFFKSGKFDGKVEQDFFGNRNCPFRLINNKVVVPDEEEVARNPRSRSAKLRAAELI